MELINPADILRHKEFEKDVNDLLEYGQLRFYTTEIHEKTGEPTSNISDYYNGEKPISDNFLKKFHKAYDSKLKKVREEIDSNAPRLASNIAIKLPQADVTQMPPNTTTPGPILSESTQEDVVNLLRIIVEKLINIQETMALLVQKIDEKSKTSRKKK